MASLDKATPTNTGQYPCDYCGSEYSSPLAAAQCEDDDRLEDNRTRQWFTRHNDQTLP